MTTGPQGIVLPMPPTRMCRCKGCGSWHYFDREHRCDVSGGIACRECGLLHDQFASMTTGIAPCLHALRSELAALMERVEAIERPNHVLWARHA